MRRPSIYKYAKHILIDCLSQANSTPCNYANVVTGYQNTRLFTVTIAGDNVANSPQNHRTPLAC